MVTLVVPALKAVTCPEVGDKHAAEVQGTLATVREESWGMWRNSHWFLNGKPWSWQARADGVVVLAAPWH